MSAPGGRTLPAFDVYAELGLGRDATTDQVQSAYRRKAKEHHPDVASDPSAAEGRMKRVNQARDLLLDPARRAEYDRARATAGAPGARPGPAGARTAPRRPTASTARPGTAGTAGTADAAAAHAERERRARADQERRARVRAEQDRWEREAEARAARDVAARAERRRGEGRAAPPAERRREPATATPAAPEPPGAHAAARTPAGPAPRAWMDLRAWLGSHVSVEIHIGDDANRRRAASRGRDEA